jgi:phage-related protein
MNIDKILNDYLGKKVRYSQIDNGDGTKEVCDIDTGDCYTVREKDGLIERAGHTYVANRRVKVETHRGIKQLLND